MRRCWYAIQRLKHLRHDPLMPLVYIGLLGIVAYGVFVINMIHWLTRPW